MDTEINLHLSFIRKMFSSAGNQFAISYLQTLSICELGFGAYIYIYINGENVFFCDRPRFGSRSMYREPSMDNVECDRDRNKEGNTSDCTDK